MTKKICVSALFILSLALGYAHAATNPAGMYQITHGVSANNVEYTGQVKIEDKGDGVYYVDWNISNFDEYQGIGLLDPEKNAVAVAYSSSGDYGLAVYKVEGGKLSGSWLTPKTEMDFGYETLEGPAGLNGTYTITDAQGDDYGDPYSGTVDIYPSGQVYHLTWYVDGSTYTGVGLVYQEYLIVAWGDDSGVLYYDIKGNELLGTYASLGANRTGVENLTRIGSGQE